MVLVDPMSEFAGWSDAELRRHRQACNVEAEVQAGLASTDDSVFRRQSADKHARNLKHRAARYGMELASRQRTD